MSSLISKFTIFQVTHTDKVYEVTINVNQFHPDDIDLQINGNKLIISGRQMAEEDSLGVSSQEFTRQINIPEVRAIQT